MIIGVRRSGKSKLLEVFKKHVEETVTDINIIHLYYNLTRFQEFKDYHVLNDYVEKFDIYSLQLKVYLRKDGKM